MRFEHIANWEGGVGFCIYFFHYYIDNGVSFMLPEMAYTEVNVEAYCLFQSGGDSEVVCLA